jgi:hypothetical protein
VKHGASPTLSLAESSTLRIAPVYFPRMDEVPTTGLAAGVASTITIAGVGVTQIFEVMPKSAIIGLCAILFGIVTYYAKRDYTRFRDLMIANSQRLEGIEKCLRDAVMVKDHRESMNGVHLKITASTERIETQLTGMDRRLVVLETKLGMHDSPTLSRDKEPAR